MFRYDLSNVYVWRKKKKRINIRYYAIHIHLTNESFFFILQKEDKWNFEINGCITTFQINE